MQETEVSMIDRNQPTTMVMPRAAIELGGNRAGRRTANREALRKQGIYTADCVKCGGIIADDTEPIEASGLKPESIRSMRIKCGNYVGSKKCNQINFVSHT